jgi:hypothetical protein
MDKMWLETWSVASKDWCHVQWNYDRVSMAYNEDFITVTKSIRVFFLYTFVIMGCIRFCPPSNIYCVLDDADKNSEEP